MGEQKLSPGNDMTRKLKETVDEAKHVVSPPKEMKKEMSAKIAAEVSEVTHESSSLKEPASQSNAQLIEDQGKQKFSASTGNVNSLASHVVMFDSYDTFVGVYGALWTWGSGLPMSCLMFH